MDNNAPIKYFLFPKVAQKHIIRPIRNSRSILEQLSFIPTSLYQFKTTISEQ